MSGTRECFIVDKRVLCVLQRQYSLCFLHLFQQKLSRGIKASLLIFTLAQAAISVVICLLLFRQRHFFEQYAVRNCFYLEKLHFIHPSRDAPVPFFNS